MKTLWFKVESTGRAVTVKIAEDANVLELMEAIIQQRPRMFGDDQDAADWHLYKTGAEGEEPEESGDTLDSRTSLILKRISPISTASANPFPIMKTLWFKVENGPADEVDIAENAYVLELMEAIIYKEFK